MRSLDYFPTELLEEILQYLLRQCADGSRGAVLALAHLARTCRRLNILATRYLYRHPLYSKWWLLADTLIARPELALQVRSLRDVARYRPLAFELAGRPFSQGVLGCLSDLYVARQPYHNTVKGYGDIIELESSEGVEILTSLCTNVEYLEARHIRLPSVFILGTLESHLRLTRVDLHHADTMDIRMLSQLAAMAPNLTHLTCRNFERQESGLAMFPAHGFPQLVDLRLLGAAIRADTLAGLLARCPKLRSFTFAAGLSRVGQFPLWQFTPGDAARALTAFAPGLTSLRLDMDALREKSRPFQDTIHSLADLTNLEHLTLDLRCWLTDDLLGDFGASWPPALDDMALVDLLPASIRSLSLRTGGLRWFIEGDIRRTYLIPKFESMRRLLMRLVAVAPVGFPRLKRLKVQRFKVNAEENKDLVAAFQRLGIKTCIN
jgi:hypothetical protein